MTSRPGLAERGLYALADLAEHDARARAALVALVNAAFLAIAAERRLGGRRLLELAREASVRWGRLRAVVLRDRLGVDTADMGDMGRIQEWEDRVFGVTGHFTERGARRAVRRETACPFARTASLAPEICAEVVHALEEATFRELHPGYRLLPLERLLSRGHTSCDFVHVLDGPRSPDAAR